MSTQEIIPRIATAPARAFEFAAALVRSIHRRRRFNAVRDLDDHMLEDIGITRSEVDAVSQLPLSRDAAEELRRLSMERRRDRDALLRARYRF